MTSFAHRLKELRKLRGLTLDKLAKELHTSKSHLWALESGSVKHPGIDLCNCVAGFFGVSNDYLIEGDPGKNMDAKKKRVLEAFEKLCSNDQVRIMNIIEGWSTLGG